MQTGSRIASLSKRRAVPMLNLPALCRSRCRVRLSRFGVHSVVWRRCVYVCDCGKQDRVWPFAATRQSDSRHASVRGGVCVMSSVGEYNTLSRSRSLRKARWTAIVRLIVPSTTGKWLTDAAETESLSISDTARIFGRSILQNAPCDICSPVTIRLTLAQPNVLVPERGVAIRSALL